MKIGIIQQSCSPNRDANLQKLAANIATAAKAGAQLVVLQELHNTPYFCQVESTDNFDLAEPTRQAEISYAVFCLKKKTNK